MNVPKLGVQIQDKFLRFFIPSTISTETVRTTPHPPPITHGTQEEGTMSVAGRIYSSTKYSKGKSPLPVLTMIKFLSRTTIIFCVLVPRAPKLEFHSGIHHLNP